MKIIIILFTLLFSLPSFSQGDLFKDGEIKLIKLDLSGVNEKNISDFKVKIFNLNFPVFFGPEPEKMIFSIIASPLGAVKGDYPLVVFNKEKQILNFNVSLSPRDVLKTEEILYAQDFNVLPQDAETVKRAATEDLELKDMLKVSSPNKLWLNHFITPVKMKINSEFGLYRVYSKHLRRRTHWGVDYHTPIGTKVKASAEGKVVLAKEFYFPGKTVLIDHGQGLYTGYSHLSKMDVKVGETVKQGQIIGRSGVSGKVTGPHLHWFAVNSRVKIDPLTLTKINLKKIR
jgi:murein DD-endopeptidase MepM/ murein hydrolase activator NlpD